MNFFSFLNISVCMNKLCHFCVTNLQKKKQVINSGHKNENNKRYNKPSTTSGVGNTTSQTLNSKLFQF